MEIGINGHTIVLETKNDNVSVLVDGMGYVPNLPAPAPPLSETLEVGAVYRKFTYRNFTYHNMTYLGKRVAGHESYCFSVHGMPGVVMWFTEGDVNQCMTLVSRPLLSQTVRPGWVIKCPNPIVSPITIDAITESNYRVKGEMRWYSLTDLDEPGFEVVSRG